MDRKELIRKYKETPRTAGVYRVVNTASGKVLLGASSDVPSMLNRHRAQLRMGGHPKPELQKDWDVEGQDNFVFEILDTLEPNDDPGYDPQDDLETLEQLWAERLALPVDSTY